MTVLALVVCHCMNNIYNVGIYVFLSCLRLICFIHNAKCHVCSLRSSLELLEYKKWFKSFTGEWVNTACTLFYNKVKKSSEETRKVSSG